MEQVQCQALCSQFRRAGTRNSSAAGHKGSQVIDMLARVLMKLAMFPGTIIGRAHRHAYLAWVGRAAVFRIVGVNLAISSRRPDGRGTIEPHLQHAPRMMEDASG